MASSGTPLAKAIFSEGPDREMSFPRSVETGPELARGIDLRLHGGISRCGVLYGRARVSGQPQLGAYLALGRACAKHLRAPGAPQIYREQSFSQLPLGSSPVMLR
jgi:hypothetical protein